MFMPYLMILFALMPTYNMGMMANGQLDLSELDNQFQSDIMVGVAVYNFLYIETGVQVYMGQVPNKLMFAPYQSDYYFRVYGFWEGIKLGYEHECWHPVISSQSGIQYRGGYDKLFIEYSTKEAK